MSEYQDINLLFCNSNKLNVERNQYERYTKRQVQFYKSRILEMQKMLHRMSYLKVVKTEKKELVKEYEDLDYMFPDSIKELYESFLVEAIDYLTFQDQSDELQNEIDEHIQNTKELKSDNYQDDTDVDDKSNNNDEGDNDNTNTNTNPNTNTKKSIKKHSFYSSFGTTPTIHTQKQFNPFSKKLKKKNVILSSKDEYKDNRN